MLRDPARDPARGARLPCQGVPRPCLAAGDRPVPRGGIGLARHAVRLHRQADLGAGRDRLHSGAIRHRPDVTAMRDICFTPAHQLARLIRARKLSATEAVRAFIAQIERVNPKVNAIVTFLPEQALKQAREFDRKRRALPFGGLPIAIKDVIATKGVRTTWGSLVYKDHVPAEDHILAE